MRGAVHVTVDKRNTYLRWAAGLVLVLGLMVSSFMAGRASVQTGAPAPALNLGPLGEQARRAEGDVFALGPVDAPLVLVTFSDYRCPFCARHSRVTESELVDRYVESGQLRIEWRDMPIFGDASLLAARAGRAAAAQDRFWEFNRAVFAAAPESGHHDLTEEKLMNFAEQVGVADLDRFWSDLHSGAFDADIEADFRQAASLGMTGTPSFVLNGHLIVGAQPAVVFNQMIEEALAGL